jgi:hypothetical protein
LLAAQRRGTLAYQIVLDAHREIVAVIVIDANFGLGFGHAALHPSVVRGTARSNGHAWRYMAPGMG